MEKRIGLIPIVDLMDEGVDFNELTYSEQIGYAYRRGLVYTLDEYVDMFNKSWGDFQPDDYFAIVIK